MIWKIQSTVAAVYNFKKMPHKQIAEKIGNNPKAVSEWLRRRGLKKCPNYSETETYLLQNFPAAHCAQFIPHKSINALKIKQCRLRKSTHANASIK